MKTKIIMALLAGSALLAACKGSGSRSYEVAGAAADSAKIVSAAADTAAAVKLIKTAELRFKVKSVQKASEDVSGLTTKYKGMVMHHEMNSSIERSSDVRVNSDSVMRVTSLSTNADITVKVPSEKLEDYMNEVSHMGLYVSLRRMDIEDRTLDYLANKMKLNSRREIIDQQKKGKVVIKHPEDVLMLKDDMIDQQISNQRVNEAVKYSVVTLNMYQSNTISKEVIANDDPSAYSLPFFNRIGLALANGWTIFKEILIIITNCWALILLGIVVWWGIWSYKKKKVISTQPNA